MTIHNDQIEEILFAFRTGESVPNICRQYSIGKTKAYELLNRVKLESVSTIDTDESCKDHKSVVGIIGDTHFPFVRDGYMDFCYDIFKREGVTEIVHIGDIVDNHNWSRHDSEPDAVSGLNEFEEALECVREMSYTFSDWPITLVLGNHDLIPKTQLKKLGLPDLLLKSFEDLFKVPHWNVCTSAVIDNVEYSHGINCTATLLTAQRKRRSCVFGHSHSKADIQFHASWDDRVFGMHVGCGFDDKSYAARYGKESHLKSIISCGVVKDGKHPSLHMMDL